MFARVNPSQAAKLLKSGAIEVIDVRDAAEWAKGHVPGARRVSLAELREDARQHLRRDGVLFVCAAGVRSETAARIALDHGLTKVYSLVGGTQSWIKAGHAVATELRVAV
ncbi:MAG: rhodanese-like domain-containing protein [Deltaproteobacteria bacterium]|nr:rhodanese-like domain-containing protein [Deltaproteobacteria bacterium]